jgi:heterotetrameric sarcosine oxidase gamma subunit
VIDEAVLITVQPAGDVVLLDLWSGDVEALCGDIVRLQVEPRRWWLLGAGDRVNALAALIADHGALAPIGGGLVRATLTGAGWRSLLMVAGLFDAEDPAFTTGSLASTMIHHIAVRIVVTGERSCDVYFAASYAPALIEHWSRAAGPHAVAVDEALV